MRWDEMRWDEMGWDEMGWDQPHRQLVHRTDREPVGTEGTLLRAPLEWRGAAALLACAVLSPLKCSIARVYLSHQIRSDQIRSDQMR